MNNCIFCKIANHEIPATILYEDEEVLVFMDIGPIVKGHALAIPKKHFDTILETPENLLSKLHRTAQRIAVSQMNGLGADGVNIVQNNGQAAGQEVPHIHVHIIPRFENDGHHWNWKAKKYDDPNEMIGLAEKMRNNL